MNIFDKILYHKKKKKIDKIKHSLKMCGSYVFLHEDIRISQPDAVIIGNNVSIDQGAKLLCWREYKMIDPIQKLDPEIVIGNGCHITRNLTIQCAGRVVLGCNVLIASDVFITDYNHGINPMKNDYLKQQLVVKNVEVHDSCWIGQNVLILPGVVIGEHSIIGAGSVVTKSIPSYTIAAGNPAKCIKHFDFSKNEWVEVI